jgi:soluble lytic murein transglycosylase-like protein
MNLKFVTLLVCALLTVCSPPAHAGPRGSEVEADSSNSIESQMRLDPPELYPPASPCALSKAETVELIRAAAEKHHVPEVLVTSIVAAESNFDCAAISPKGAVGLMQLMPETAVHFGANPIVPAENIDAGTRYLGWLIQHFRNSRDAIRHVIAAYNAGPAAVHRYRGVPPFRETRAYVTRVLGFLRQFSGRSIASIEMLPR